MKQTIHETIRTLRKQKCLSQQALAERLGVSYQAVSKWERGINLPDILLLPALCLALDISADELLKLPTPLRHGTRDEAAGAAENEQADE